MNGKTAARDQWAAEMSGLAAMEQAGREPSPGLLKHLIDVARQALAESAEALGEAEYRAAETEVRYDKIASAYYMALTRIRGVSGMLDDARQAVREITGENQG